MRAAEALLSGCIDYAGLFPPANLDLPETVLNYGQYRDGLDAWALGRLVLPASSLVDLRASPGPKVADWPLSVLLGPEWEGDLRCAQELGVPLRTVEFRPRTPAQVQAVRRALPAAATIFFEVCAGAQAEEYLSAIADAGACAKLRTGGLTPNAIPSAPEIAGFLSSCVRLGIAFKATAGLHHALRAVHPLTYEDGSEQAPMHGFVNLILAASTLYGGGDRERAIALLEDDTPQHFSAVEDGIRWCDERFSTQALVETRTQFMVSFGSCSFTEPLSELRMMG